MNPVTPPNPNRLEELRCDAAAQGLSDAERAEMAALLGAGGATRGVGDEHDADQLSLDRAAAALMLAFAAQDGEQRAEMPASLRAKIIDAVARAPREGGSGAAPKLRLAGTPQDRPAPLAIPATRMNWFPWLLAAACLALAVVAWWPQRGGSGEVPSLTLAEARQQLLAAPGSRTVSWAQNDLGVTGDIVWNNERQEGYMRFAGLPANDPTDIQYQLWIFDGKRQLHNEFHAVDGGVFDVEKREGEVIIRITPKLRVFEPALFAITSEPPGGVVKHTDTEKHRILLVAPVEG